MLPLLLIAGLLIAGAALWLWKANEHLHNTKGQLQIHFINVGQGDAALLILPTGERIMVDVGPAESTETVLSHLTKWRVEALDMVILSHSHEDHAGALSALAEALPIGGLLHTDAPPQDCDLPTRKITAGETFSIGEVHFSVLGPVDDEADGENVSMILRIDYGKRSFLFTGDTEAGGEEALVNTLPHLLNADLLKVAHHGSASSSTETFLAAVCPEIAVISASADNPFGHPAPEVLSRLSAYDCMIYRTDREGSVVFLCDGKKLSRYIP